MSIYNIDISVTTEQLLPPEKRSSKMLAWVVNLVSPLQYLSDLIFTSYRTGSTASPYASGAYSKGDRVRYYYAIYESLSDLNTDLPTAATWRKVQDNFIGVTERAIYTGQKIVLEYAINKWFNTQFRQPPLQADIYITSPGINVPFFRIGSGEGNSSSVFSNASSEFVIDSYDIAQNYSIIINVPLAVFTALGNNDDDRENIIRNFVDRYIISGIYYKVQTY
jgi:hypothetical protein